MPGGGVGKGAYTAVMCVVGDSGAGNYWSSTRTPGVFRFGRGGPTASAVVGRIAVYFYGACSRAGRGLLEIGNSCPYVVIVGIHIFCTIGYIWGMGKIVGIYIDRRFGRKTFEFSHSAPAYDTLRLFVVVCFRVP